jgi:hypothetical protein
LIGQTISHYRVLEKLGGGGMGVVYKATDLRLNRFVALKFLSSDLTRDADAKQRFVQEAQAASALDHPNICTIHEIDETSDGELFLTLAYYEGETLKHRIERGPLPIDDAIDIATQVARALARAHETGIVHRDIKPANLMLPKDGPVKIVDFGLAKLVGHSDLTKTGTTVGTVAYMSPEQIRGAEAGPAADVWAVGVVLYQMLAGRRPFDGKDDLGVISSILDDTPRPIGELRPETPEPARRIVARALSKQVSARYRSATELLADLVALQAERRTAHGSQRAVRQIVKRPIVFVPALAVLALGAIAAIGAYRHAARVRRAHDEAIPQIRRLIAESRFIAAFDIASTVEQTVGDDRELADVWPQFSARGSIASSPAGADVYVQPYAATDDQWRHLGRTPIENVRLPRGALKLRVQKSGFEPQVLASPNPGNLFRNVPLGDNLELQLVAKGVAPDMVQVPGGRFPVSLSGFDADDFVSLDPFSIDRFEVTNKDFKRFVDGGGYTRAQYWTGASTGSFTDSTGRPGPSTWELGEYPPDKAEYPVGGVSWFEASAFCRAQDKQLPTVYHWARAALAAFEGLSPLAPAILAGSRFGKEGAAPVGASSSLGPYGTYDMAGNLREWVWNDSSSGRRWILGGAWNDPPWLAVVPTTLQPLDRSATNGFRCMRLRDSTMIPDRLYATVENHSDRRAVKPVSDEVFDVFRRQMAPTIGPLDARLESTDASRRDWVRERWSVRAGYESDRLSMYVFVPKTARPPYQATIYFPGLSDFIGRASSDALEADRFDFIVKSGRVFVYPIYKGSWERWDAFLSLRGEEYDRTFRLRMFQWRQELGRVVDLLSQRGDVDRERIAFVGVSFGASTAAALLALETRIKTGVLLAAGLPYRVLPPEADALNYLPRITMPILMIGGNRDYIFPLDLAQAPMYERLGTPPDQKRHVVFDSGHVDFPRSDLIREVLGWLDKYLGPVQGQPVAAQ